jgi:uncharacterized membrane protein
MITMGSSPDTSPNPTAHALERRVGTVLGLATNGSVLLLAFGVGGMLLAGLDPLGKSFPRFDLAALPRDLADRATSGFLWLGLLAVILTPSIRVIAALAGFAGAGERRMAVVALIVLAVICLGAIVGAGG